MGKLNYVFWGNVFLDGIVDEHVVSDWIDENYSPESGMEKNEFLERNLIRFIEENIKQVNLRAGDNTANVSSSLFNLDPDTSNNFTYIAPVGNSEARNQTFFSEMPSQIEKKLLRTNKPTAHLLAIINKEKDRDFARQQDAAYGISDSHFENALAMIQNADVFFTSAYELREEKYDTTVGFLTNLTKNTLTVFDGADYDWLGNSIEESIEQGAKYHIFLIDEDFGREKRQFFYDNAGTRIFIETRGKKGSTIYVKNKDSDEKAFDIPIHFYKEEKINGKEGNANGTGDAYLAAFSYYLFGWLNEISQHMSVLDSLDRLIQNPDLCNQCIEEAGHFASYVAGEKCAYDVPRIPQEKMKKLWIEYNLPENQPIFP